MKNLRIVMLSFLILIVCLFLIIFLTRPKREDSIMHERNKQVVEFLDTIPYGKGSLWFGMWSLYKNDFAIEVDSIFSSMNYLEYQDDGSAKFHFSKIDLAPFYINSDELIFFKRQSIDIVSATKGNLVHLYTTVSTTEESDWHYPDWDVNTIHAVSIPTQNKEGMTFSILLRGKETMVLQIFHYSSESGFILLEEKPIDFQIPNELFFPDTIKFFAYQDCTYYVILQEKNADSKDDTITTHLMLFSDNGEYVDNYGEVNAIIPHINDKSNLYYLKPLQKTARWGDVCGNFVLMKNKKELLTIEKPIIDAYFLNENELFLRCFNGRKAYQDSLLYGRSGQTREGYILELDSSILHPLFLEQRTKGINPLFSKDYQHGRLMYIPTIPLVSH